uniref:Uncharacterized protein n=1 Tax=Tanacetum cinerariifolium TaxID=118510 RepID=A0A699GV95_TANCI|nr:hypothetical protein [Tanacetum cinerariifolium]
MGIVKGGTTSMGCTAGNSLLDYGEWLHGRKAHLLGDNQIPSVGVFDEALFYTFFRALGLLLEEIHVTLAHLGKKWTRLQLYTKVEEEKGTHTLDTATQLLVTTSEHQRDGVRKIEMASGLNRHSETLEESTERRRKKVVQDVIGSTSGSPSITPLVARTNDLESQMIDGKLVVDDLVNEDNDSEVDDVYDETATYMASTSFNVNKASKSGSGKENKSLYEQWQESHGEDPHDDDFDNPSLTYAQMKFANAFDINLRGQLI